MNGQNPKLSLSGAEAPPPITVREEDPRVRAARRAAELREHGVFDVGTDKFYVPQDKVPDGWTYEWKRFATLGAQDPAYQVTLAQQGWDAVPVTRHPEMMPMGHQGNTIERDGMILMERPTEITDEARAREKRAARDQVRDKEAQIAGAPPGTFDRDNKGTPLASIKRSYEPVMIPK